MTMRATSKKAAAAAKSRDTVVVSMRLPKTLVKRLDQIARREDRSRNKTIEMAARAYVGTKAA